MLINIYTTTILFIITYTNKGFLSSYYQQNLQNPSFSLVTYNSNPCLRFQVRVPSFLSSQSYYYLLLSPYPLEILLYILLLAIQEGLISIYQYNSYPYYSAGRGYLYIACLIRLLTPTLPRPYYLQVFQYRYRQLVSNLFCCPCLPLISV